MAPASKPLTKTQVSRLVRQGCTAADWRSVTVAPRSDLSRIRDVHFYGRVQLGSLDGTRAVDGVELPCGLYNASIADSTIGDRVRIANVGSIISNYVIEDGVLIQDVASLVAEPQAAYGNGVELEAINEGGGRRITILNELTSQVAYVQGMFRHDPEFCRRLELVIQARVSLASVKKGRVGAQASILHCGVLRNVVVGPHARIVGAQLLENGTVGSCKEHATVVGEGVQAKSFVLAEGARVEGGAILDKVFVGQGVKMGKQYSAENSLFFANCEAFHGEAVSVFAGPYTVTHHKSTLLIAGLFSFYNAGSGTNQSNHMYKLGPVHQAILERGCKTGSFSYLMEECHIGAFSVVIGKHYANIDAPNLPFSYILEDHGTSVIIPGTNLGSVGTVRDGEKWPKRDNRKAPDKRDLIIFDVFTPYTVEKMRRGRAELQSLSRDLPDEGATVKYGGAELRGRSLAKGVKYYSLAIDRYLNEKLAERLVDALAQSGSWSNALAALAPKSPLKDSAAWTDLAGLIAPRERVAELEVGVADGRIRTYDELVGGFQKIYDAYGVDEWRYVFDALVQEYKIRPDGMTKEQAVAAVDRWERASTSLREIILEDSTKEFGAFARIGFGLDQTEDNARRDFEAVRGTSETNGVVQKLAAEAEVTRQRKEQFKQAIRSSPS
jgi:hypothetical protein